MLDLARLAHQSPLENSLRELRATKRTHQLGRSDLVRRFIRSVTYFLGGFGRRMAQFPQHSHEILSREPPLERLSDSLVMSLKSQQTFC